MSKREAMDILQTAIPGAGLPEGAYMAALAVTDVCGNNCVLCFEKNSAGRKNNVAGRFKHISLRGDNRKGFARLMRFLSEDEMCVTLGFTGGDPLENPEVIKLAAAAFKQYRAKKEIPVETPLGRTTYQPNPLVGITMNPTSFLASERCNTEVDFKAAVKRIRKRKVTEKTRRMIGALGACDQISVSHGSAQAKSVEYRDMGLKLLGELANEFGFNDKLRFRRAIEFSCDTYVDTYGIVLKTFGKQTGGLMYPVMAGSALYKERPSPLPVFPWNGIKPTREKPEFKCRTCNTETGLGKLAIYINDLTDNITTACCFVGGNRYTEVDSGVTLEQLANMSEKDAKNAVLGIVSERYTAPSVLFMKEYGVDDYRQMAEKVSGTRLEHYVRFGHKPKFDGTGKLIAGFRFRPCEYCFQIGDMLASAEVTPEQFNERLIEEMGRREYGYTSITN